jgi:hypothetical protein
MTIWNLLEQLFGSGPQRTQRSVKMGLHRALADAHRLGNFGLGHVGQVAKCDSIPLAPWKPNERRQERLAQHNSLGNIDSGFVVYSDDPSRPLTESLVQTHLEQPSVAPWKWSDPFPAGMSEREGLDRRVLGSFVIRCHTLGEPDRSRKHPPKERLEILYRGIVHHQPVKAPSGHFG